eukprot:jgi/Mesvir1/6027/Mv00771-RA.1
MVLQRQQAFSITLLVLLLARASAVDGRGPPGPHQAPSKGAEASPLPPTQEGAGSSTPAAAQEGTDPRLAPLKRAGGTSSVSSIIHSSSSVSSNGGDGSRPNSSSSDVAEAGSIAKRSSEGDTHVPHAPRTAQPVDAVAAAATHISAQSPRGIRVLASLQRATGADAATDASIGARWLHQVDAPRGMPLREDVEDRAAAAQPGGSQVGTRRLLGKAGVGGGGSAASVRMPGFVPAFCRRSVTEGVTRSTRHDGGSGGGGGGGGHDDDGKSGGNDGGGVEGAEGYERLEGYEEGGVLKGYEEGGAHEGYEEGGAHDGYNEGGAHEGEGMDWHQDEEVDDPVDQMGYRSTYGHAGGYGDQGGGEEGEEGHVYGEGGSEGEEGATGGDEGAMEGEGLVDREVQFYDHHPRDDQRRRRGVGWGHRSLLALSSQQQHGRPQGGHLAAQRRHLAGQGGHLAPQGFSKLTSWLTGTSATHYMPDGASPSGQSGRGGRAHNPPAHGPARSIARGEKPMARSFQPMASPGKAAARGRGGGGLVGRGGVSSLARNHVQLPPGKQPRPTQPVITQPNAFKPPPGSAPVEFVYHHLVSANGCEETRVACSDEAREHLGLDLREGGLGTCAVVGLGRNLLEQKLGPEIDAHDTVVRFGNVPMEGYEKWVGHRTDVTFLREPARFFKGKPGTDRWGGNLRYPVTKFYLSQKAEFKSPTLFHGKPYMNEKALSREGVRHADLVYAKLEKYAKLRAPDAIELFAGQGAHLKPTEGMKMVFTLLHSRLCTRIDLYGFSRDGLGHYFGDAMGVNPITGRDSRGGMLYYHVAGLEHWVYEIAMANGLACLY